DLIAYLMAIPGDVQTRGGVSKALLRHALGGILPDRIARRNTKSDFTDFVNDGLANEWDGLIECFHPGAAAARRGFVETDVGHAQDEGRLGVGGAAAALSHLRARSPEPPPPFGARWRGAVARRRVVRRGPRPARRHGDGTGRRPTVVQLSEAGRRRRVRALAR